MIECLANDLSMRIDYCPKKDSWFEETAFVAIKRAFIWSMDLKTKYCRASVLP